MGSSWGVALSICSQKTRAFTLEGNRWTVQAACSRCGCCSCCFCCCSCCCCCSSCCCCSCCCCFPCCCCHLNLSMDRTGNKSLLAEEIQAASQRSVSLRSHLGVSYTVSIPSAANALITKPLVDPGRQRESGAVSTQPRAAEYTRRLLLHPGDTKNKRHRSYMNNSNCCGRGFAQKERTWSQNLQEQQHHRQQQPKYQEHPKRRVTQALSVPSTVFLPSRRDPSFSRITSSMGLPISADAS